MSRAADGESRSGGLYQVLRWNLESVRALPSPAHPWQWWTVVEQGPVSKQLAVQLKNIDCIVPADRDGYWKTTDRLARYIHDKFTFTLDPVGQSELPVDVDPGHGRDRDRDDTDPSGGWQQLDLNGRDATAAYRRRVAAREQDLYEIRAANGREGGVPTWMRADDDESQLPITVFDTAGAPGRLARPAGDVYSSPVPALT